MDTRIEPKPTRRVPAPPPTTTPARAPKGDDGLLEACRAVGRAQGIRFRRPLGAADRAPRLVDLCAASGIRHRKVDLEDGWWRGDVGPLLAYRRAAEEGAPPRPVAVLPRRGGYVMVQPGWGPVRVDAAVAETLEPEAYVFYRPLPAEPLSLRGLLRAGLRGVRGDLATLLLLTLSGGLLALLTPLVTQRVVDSTIVRHDRGELLTLTLVLAAGAVGVALFQLVRSLTVVRLKCRTGISLQAALWDRLLSLPVPFFRRFTVGDISARSMGIDRIDSLLTEDVAGSVLALLSASFSLAILFHYSAALAVAATLLALLFAVASALLSYFQLRHLRALHAAGGELAGLVHALLGGIVKLRVAGAEQRAFSAWAALFAKQRSHSVNAQRLSNARDVAAMVYGVGSTLALFALVGLSGELRISVGEFLAFSAAFAQFQAAALAALGVVPTVLAFVPTYERMRPILEEVPEVGSRQEDPGPLRGELELRGVSFRYPGGPQVLDGVSIRAEPGEFVALVGPSGSGKSTCLRLLLGFEQPEAGEVRVDGMPLASLNPHLVRRQIGVVLQNGRPMVGTIFHNITGSLPLTLDDAWRAARMVGLDEEIRALPMSMLSHVNQRGLTFSGGQRQRMLIARALVADPRILLLDEATSALDNRTQDVVTRSLAELGPTRVVVAHRLSTIRHADRIYVLDHGRVVQEGTFDELVSQPGLFARMAQRQTLDPTEEP